MSSHEERLSLYNEGLCDREIGEVVGLTGSAIGYWRRKNNLPKHTKNKQEREKEQKKVQLFNEGRSTGEMAEILGLHQSTISHWKERRGYARRRRMGAVERDKIIKLSKTGKTNVEIASELGFHPSTIQWWKRKLNLSHGKSRGRHVKRTQKEVETIEKLYREGYTDIAIAEKLKRSNVFVHNIRKELGLKSKHKSGETLEVYREKKWGVFNRKVINLYHKHPEWGWQDLVHAVDLDVNPKNITRIKIIVGNHLMRVCRSQESCAFKPLLPENVLEESRQ